mmetsp:Transcript_173269/g.421442  ORF Transcript_173269/g.421442 Transcript_173269/m.421442 type:complete len:352 (-) Transcript_173269:305-1360(-)
MQRRTLVCFSNRGRTFRTVSPEGDGVVAGALRSRARLGSGLGATLARGCLVERGQILPVRIVGDCAVLLEPMRKSADARRVKDSAARQELGELVDLEEATGRQQVVDPGRGDTLQLHLEDREGEAVAPCGVLGEIPPRDAYLHRDGLVFQEPGALLILHPVGTLHVVVEQRQQRVDRDADAVGCRKLEGRAAVHGADFGPQATPDDELPHFGSQRFLLRGRRTGDTASSDTRVDCLGRVEVALQKGPHLLPGQLETLLDARLLHPRLVMHLALDEHLTRTRRPVTVPADADQLRALLAADALVVVRQLVRVQVGRVDGLGVRHLRHVVQRLHQAGRVRANSLHHLVGVLAE